MARVGATSSSGSPSNGRRAGSVASGLGLRVRSLQTGCIAVAGSPSCTAPDAYLPAVTAIGLRMQVSGVASPARAWEIAKDPDAAGRRANMLEEFPDKPKGMHLQTYERWRRVHDVAEERSNSGLMGFVERLGRRISRRA